MARRTARVVKAAVVGHVEIVDFARVPRVPAPGDIVHADASWREVGGGGAGAAVQLAKLAGECTFFTAVGDDDLGRYAIDELTRLGVRVEAGVRPVPTRRAFTHVDPDGERTITVLGERLAPAVADRLPWDELDGIDAVYFTAGDAASLVAARRARVVVATTRVLNVLTEAGVWLDAVVGSMLDPAEAYTDGDVEPRPGLVVRTAGEAGGWFAVAGEPETAYEPAPLPGPVVDRYGAGDSFAAGLAFALAERRSPRHAVDLAARCGAAVVTGSGPYEAQLTS